ncbi:uncharacterized protein LOC110402699 [Numida meleagris]|uniref:uncharacterized protein LOC110402699 n=1 Tax=Numida meleagris TaxID=8996 RepID=UPI000B3DDED8|nr:uncharacterized protein LOC110402699 [Numida meleagris]
MRASNGQRWGRGLAKRAGDWWRRGAERDGLPVWHVFCKDSLVSTVEYASSDACVLANDGKNIQEKGKEAGPRLELEPEHTDSSTQTYSTEELLDNFIKSEQAAEMSETSQPEAQTPPSVDVNEASSSIVASTENNSSSSSSERSTVSQPEKWNPAPPSLISCLPAQDQEQHHKAAITAQEPLQHPAFSRGWLQHCSSQARMVTFLLGHWLHQDLMEETSTGVLDPWISPRQTVDHTAKQETAPGPQTPARKGSWSPSTSTGST